ncbi:MAG TPA: hypothetical protein PK954_10005, partial [Anaerolineales bacterium]|nr:hypothetical protein [Anaerolineales bacterium]
LLPRWRIWHLALAVIVLGFGLRAYRLDNKNLWYDEGFSVFMARQPLTELPEETALDVHPPAYFAVLHGWRAVAGEPLDATGLAHLTGELAQHLEGALGV